MIIQLYGVNFTNKGAELMLQAILQELSAVNSDIAFVGDLRCGSFKERSAVGLQHLAWLFSRKAPFAGPIIDSMVSVIPRPLRHSLRIVRERDVDVVLNAAGFAYSDHLGTLQTELMATSVQRWKQQNKKIILLPQAFGPFETARIRETMLQIVENVDWIFSRDQISYKHLMNLAEGFTHISVAPDFTCLVDGELPAYFDQNLLRQPCIIPNYRMIEAMSQAHPENYIPFLVSCVNYLLTQGFSPFILIHETMRDYELALDLNARIDKPLPIIQESNPLFLKGILGSCYFVISSRYHGLVNALSQGVPCIATGWSHKYQMLLEDYNCPEFLFSLEDPKDRLMEKIGLLVEEPSRTNVVKRLTESNIRQRELAKKMWEKVLELLSLA